MSSSAMISPGADILKTWQGIVEISLRVACAVLCFIILICAGVTIGAINAAQDNAEEFGGEYADRNRYRSAAGWVLFVAIMGMMYEPLMVVIRFLNVLIVKQNFLIFGIVDFGISVVFAISLLAGGAANAAYSADNASDLDEPSTRIACDTASSGSVIDELCNNVKTVRNAEGAAAAFSFFGMMAFGALAGIVLLTVLMGRQQSQHGVSDPSDYKEDMAQ